MEAYAQRGEKSIHTRRPATCGPPLAGPSQQRACLQDIATWFSRLYTEMSRFSGY